MKVLVIQKGEFPDETDVEDIEVPDCWLAVRELRDHGLHAQAENTARCWALAKALLEELLEISRQGV
ncbi:hypothetical protein LCGC14_1105780 [marine sediment metagenome]|uniref:Uncharacterized protein n=1 Tax=marine sediment metagenome TaxID=412755 RepID=A0A0F9MW32_9ZZZZ